MVPFSGMFNACVLFWGHFYCLLHDNGTKSTFLLNKPLRKKHQNRIHQRTHIQKKTWNNQKAQKTAQLSTENVIHPEVRTDPEELSVMVMIFFAKGLNLLSSSASTSVALTCHKHRSTKWCPSILEIFESFSNATSNEGGPPVAVKQHP